MPTPWVLLIGETPSLTASLLDFLEASLDARGVDIVPVGSLAEAEQVCAQRKSETRPILVSACNQYRCETPYQWPRSSLKDCHFILVGGRDSGPAGQPLFHQIRLPPRVGELEGLLHMLLGTAA